MTPGYDRCRMLLRDSVPPGQEEVRSLGPRARRRTGVEYRSVTVSMGSARPRRPDGGPLTGTGVEYGYVTVSAGPVWPSPPRGVPLTGTTIPVNDRGRMLLPDGMQWPGWAQQARWRSADWDLEPGEVPGSSTAVRRCPPDRPGRDHHEAYR